jgi:L-seryl-tRNA(Ser) seleniumtransferase
MGIYEELGVRPFINAYRPLTRLGGSTLPECVLDAMREASERSVDVVLLQQKIGDAIALLTQNEAAFVSCGAASGITLATAACIAGTDPVLSERLPNTDGMKNEVVMQTRDQGYKCDVAIRCAGGRIVHIGDKDGASEQDLSMAINEKTAALFVLPSDEPGKMAVEQMISVARAHNVPVLVDAAFGVPPKKTFWRYTRDMGADAVFISGGKGLRGPQCTGLVLGKRWIVKACAFHGFPNDRIGRVMKVGKEELAGIYAAVKFFMDQDEASDRQMRARQMDFIISCVEVIPNVTLQRLHRTRAMINFDSAEFGFTSASARQSLLNDVPSVYLELSDGKMLVSTECLQPGEEKVVANQLRKLFNDGRVSKSCSSVAEGNNQVSNIGSE